MKSQLFLLTLFLLFTSQRILCTTTTTNNNNKTDGRTVSVKRSGGVIRTGSQVWCVAKPHADQGALERGLNFACGEGGADCSAIQPNGACYNPNTLIAHASYAFNSYYQKKGRNYWNCYFQNAALLVVTDPSYGSCTYPAV